MTVAGCNSTFLRTLVAVYCLTVILLGAQLAGCAVEATAVPAIKVDLAERIEWLREDEVERYRCEIGTLVCEAGTGRASSRFCRCVD